jgi:hypothetical protein
MKAGKLVLLAVLFCFLSVGMLVLFADHAQAGTAAKNFEADQAQKKGLDALASKKFDQDRLPGKLKIGFAFGSLVAAVAVIKYF